MSIDLDQFKQIFYEESFEGLDTMESGLLGMTDGGTDLDVVNDIFRAAHSIKGGSATFGFSALASFTHIMEGLLDEMREGKREADPDVVNILLESVDEMRSLMTAYQNDEEPDVEEMKILQQKLEKVCGMEPTPSSDAEKADDGLDADDASKDEVRRLGWHIEFTPHDDLLTTGNDPALLLSELHELGNLTLTMDDSDLPTFANMNPEQCYVKWSIDLLEKDLESVVEEEQITEIFEWVEDECDLVIKGIYPEREKSDRRAGDRRADSEDQGGRREGSRRTESRRPADKKPKVQATTIRVDTNRIDELIDMVGELVITQSMLGQLGEEFEMDKLVRLREGLEELERNSREIQEAVMRVRMQPISFAFNRFPRMIHDLAGKLDKKVRLELIGEETEMDKTVMEKINDPLVHLVRNSMDHGLEGPEERLAACKEEEGYVRLKAFHQGGSIVVEVSDDGRGLNREMLFNKGVEKGIFKESDVLTDEQVFMVLFAAGFSTAQALSDISGRGVGLDVVRRNIEGLGGNVSVRSVFGEGTIFTIRLPLTLAVLDGQLLAVDNQTYVLPLTAIIESLQMNAESISALAGDTTVYRLRDEYIPVVSLSELFSTGDMAKDLEGKLLVIVEWADRRMGLMVDELLGQQQVVIKSLETNYERVMGLSGATILGDGTVSLILDISGLMDMSSKVLEKLNETKSNLAAPSSTRTGV